MRRAVSSTSESSIDCPAISRISALAAACACGPPASRASASARTACVELVRLHHLVDQADFQRLARADALGGEEIARGLSRPDGAQDIGTDGRGNEAEPDFRRGEARVARGDANVAGGGQPHAAAERRALNAGDGRLGHFREPPQHRGELARVREIVLETRPRPPPSSRRDRRRRKSCCRARRAPRRGRFGRRRAIRPKPASIRRSIRASNALWRSGRFIQNVATCAGALNLQLLEHVCLLTS